MTDAPEIPPAGYDREGERAKINARGYMSDAGISSDGLYRYWLTRDWSRQAFNPGMMHRWEREDMKLPFVMFNPSTANADVDDPTIRRCIGFAKAWGYGGIQVVNLFAYRSTDPRVIPTFPPWHAIGALAADGTANVKDRFIANMARHSAFLGFPKVVCAWGALAKGHGPRVSRVLEIIKLAGGVPQCLGTTKEGFPRHPLYVPLTQAMVPYEPA